MLVMGLALGPSLMVISIIGVLLSQSTVVLCIKGMDEAHYACTFKNSKFALSLSVMTQQVDS